MLESLSLQNLQSHKNSVINFSPGITCIVGANNAGKTAILRALWCLAFNPKGYYSKLKRHKKFFPVIKAKWNGHIIERNKDGYVLDGRPYHAVRDTVPKDIAVILNLNEINFKMIREELFLISMPPGQRAKLINRASGLDSQEELIGYCKRQIKEHTDEIKIKAHLRTSLQSTISKLTPILDIEEDIERIGKDLGRIEEIETEFGDISEKYDRLIELNPIFEQSKLLNELSKNTKEITDINTKLEVRGREIVHLGYSIDRLERMGEIMELEEAQKNLQILLTDITKRDAKIHEQMKEAKDLSEKLDRLFEIMDTVDTNTRRLEKAVEELKEAYKTVKVCPLCNSELKQ